MRIQITKVRDWFAPKMDLRSAWEIVTREYCLPLTRADACSRKCKLCKSHLEKAFDLSEARNPAALLTYSARLERALVIEETRTHEAPDLHIETSGIGMPNDGEENPFAEFLGMF